MRSIRIFSAELLGVGDTGLRIGVTAEEFGRIFPLFGCCNITKEAVCPACVAVIAEQGAHSLVVCCAFLGTGETELGQSAGGARQAGQIPARIDSHNKVLHARHADQRTATFQKALAMGDEYVRDSMALLLRINLMRHDFVVKPANSGDKQLGPSKSSRQERHAMAPQERMPIAFDATGGL